MRHFTIYYCHACGWIQGQEEDDLACAQCGEPRTMVESVEVVEEWTDEAADGPGWVAA